MICTRCGAALSFTPIRRHGQSNPELVAEMEAQRSKRQEAGLCVPCFRGVRGSKGTEERPMAEPEAAAWKDQMRMKLARLRAEREGRPAANYQERDR